MSDEPVPLAPGELESFLGEVSSNGSTEDGSFFDVLSEPVPVEPEPSQDQLFDEPIQGDGQCVICGAATFRPPGLTATGRRRRAPKYCDLHKRSVTGEPKPEFTIHDVENQLRKIQGELSDDVMLFGTLTGPFFPVTGYYIVDNADAFTTAILKLCKNNIRMMRLLHRAAQVAPIYQVAKFGAGVGVSVQVDQNKHDPHSTMAQRLGVSRAYDAVYNNSNGAATSMGSNSFTAPPKYATVQ